MTTPTTPDWTWPQGRAIVLYHWSWFDPQEGDIVVGWSQRDTTDEAGYIHLEAENPRPARSVQVDPEARSFLFIEPHTFTALTPLPLSLQDADGRPLPWIRELLGAS